MVGRRLSAMAKNPTVLVFFLGARDVVGRARSAMAHVGVGVGLDAMHRS